MDFSGKLAVVTGGADGIGRCITERFLDAGAFVAMIDIDKQAGAALSARYDKLLFYPGDITSAYN